mmetsp:Transcript_16307/g.27920  ORF Transcript_16307/g.27920 Transcript_16307/m.27920 type:complete len:411 (+) Transcript_16307:222-1454(+)
MTSFEKFGNPTPFTEPSWYQGLPTPYYNETHVAYRAKCRAFVEKELMNQVGDWDESGTFPKDLLKKAYAAGVFGIWPKEYGGNGPENADIFHYIILNDELCRTGSGGVSAAIWTPSSIALPPVLAHGSEEMKREVATAVIRGEKSISLALTEPWTGSDLAHIRTTARREGDYFIVNGAKKFITGAGYADWFTTAVRTGPDGGGMGGVSLLLIPRNTPGLTVRRMKTQGWWMSYTGYLTFDDVKVPVKNLIGKENHGFLPIMHNFNMERFGGIVMCVRFARVCLEDASKYAATRKTFGKTLNSHQAIRFKLVNMARRIEALSSWMESAALQYKLGVDPVVLGRTTALMKVHATQTLEYCAREASQVLGGNSYLRTGPGQRIERIYREVRVVAIGGGSEEILLDLAARMSKL